MAEALGLEGSDVPFSFMVDGFLEDALIELDLAGSFLVDWFVFSWVVLRRAVVAPEILE